MLAQNNKNAHLGTADTGFENLTIAQIHEIQ